MTAARLNRACPAGVIDTPRRLRSNRMTPSTCSSSATALDTAGCDRCNCFAAFRIPPTAPTVTSVCRSRSLTRRLSRMGSNCMVIAENQMLSDDSKLELPQNHKLLLRLAYEQCFVGFGQDCAPHRAGCGKA